MKGDRKLRETSLPPEVAAALSAIEAARATPASLESQTLDFKRDADDPRETYRELVETAACLANSDGGYIVQGVDDRSTGLDAFRGSRLDPRDVRYRVRELTRPPLDVAVQECVFAGARLLLISIDPSAEFHSDTKGRAPRRYGRDCLPMDPGEQRRLSEGRRPTDWSAQPGPRGGVPDERAILAAREHLNASLRPDRRALAGLSPEDLLRALGVVQEERMLRAGQVLFTASGVRVLYQYKDSPGGEPVQIERLEGPLVVVYDRVMGLVRARRRLTPLTLPNGQQLAVEDFPELAVREALTNALMHQDCRRAETVVVEHSPRTLVVTSPGPLVAGVTIENILTHPSKPRNPILTRACRILELAEEVGRGVDRMYREMIRSGQPVPEINDTGDYVRVVLTGGAPDLNIARFVAERPESFRSDTDAMLVLLKLCGQRTIDAHSVAGLLQKSPAEAETSLRHLAGVDVGLIEPTRETARRSHPRYRFQAHVIRSLGSAVPYARHSSEDVERRVIAHLREYGRITNATVQNLFNVKVQRANQILREFRDQGVIVRTSQATRGPSVEYGPGPRFPRPVRKRKPRAVGDDPALRDGGDA